MTVTTALIVDITIMMVVVSIMILAPPSVPP
jgi:hypothetical protein